MSGHQVASLEVNPAEHDVQHTVGRDAVFTGGKFNFKSGVRLEGTMVDCESIVCEGTLIVGEHANIQAAHIQAQIVIVLGKVNAEVVRATGTLFAWSGTIQSTRIEYGAMEKCSACKVKGALDEISTSD